MRLDQDRENEKRRRKAHNLLETPLSHLEGENRKPTLANTQNSSPHKATQEILGCVGEGQMIRAETEEERRPNCVQVVLLTQENDNLLLQFLLLVSE